MKEEMNMVTIFYQSFPPLKDVGGGGGFITLLLHLLPTHRSSIHHYYYTNIINYHQRKDGAQINQFGSNKTTE